MHVCVRQTCMKKGTRKVCLVWYVIYLVKYEQTDAKVILVSIFTYCIVPEGFLTQFTSEIWGLCFHNIFMSFTIYCLNDMSIQFSFFHAHGDRAWPLMLVSHFPRNKGRIANILSRIPNILEVGFALTVIKSTRWYSQWIQKHGFQVFRGNIMQTGESSDSCIMSMWYEIPIPLSDVTFLNDVTRSFLKTCGKLTWILCSFISKGFCDLSDLKNISGGNMSHVLMCE